MARPDVIFNRNLLEVNDTTLVENILTFLLLSTGKLCHVRVIAGRHVLMPTFLNVVSLQSLFFLNLHIFHVNENI